MLTVTASFPPRVRAGERATFAAAVTVRNDTGRRVEGLAASRPDLWLEQGGEVVAPPLPRDDVGLVLDLAPGAARVLDAEGSLLDVDGQPLPAGRYEVRAVLRVGETVSVGGPWPLELS